MLFQESGVQEPESSEPQDEPTPPSAESTQTPKKCSPPGGTPHSAEATAASSKTVNLAETFGPGLSLMGSPPASTSSPRMVVVGDHKSEGSTEEEEEEFKDREMNVDQSINSAVINGLFEGILELSEDQREEDDEEEEDALNISSMSLLTPLAETVAAVVKSPERRMMVGATPCQLHATHSSCYCWQHCVFTDFHSGQLVPHQEQHSREHLLS